MRACGRRLGTDCTTWGWWPAAEEAEAKEVQGAEMHAALKGFCADLAPWEMVEVGDPLIAIPGSAVLPSTCAAIAGIIQG